MAEPKPGERDTAEPPGGRPGPPPARPAALPPGRVERGFERGLSLAQLTVVLPVVVLLISGVGAFVYGTVVAVHSAAEIAGHPYDAHNLRLFLTEIDLFLIGATLIIAGFGLYELFVSEIDPSGLGSPLPAWLEMNDLNDLKARVISMIILVIAVRFVDVLLEIGGSVQILYLGGGVALVILALTLYLRFGSETKS